MLEIKAYAKVNLGLDVLRKREDGYHDVKMIMQSVDLFDVLTFSVMEENAAEASGWVPPIIIESDSEEIPLNEDNLVYRACRMVMDKYNIKQGVKVTIEKHIPAAAGMAGGSTDCAAAFKGMDELFGLGLSLSEMQEMGVRIGADVPYCMMGGTALSEGIGEILTRLPNIPKCIFLIAKPACSVSTKEVYTSLRVGELTEKEHPDIDGIVKSIKEQDLYKIISKMGNVLERVTIPMHPEIEDIKSVMLENGALNALMSGSGPTVFGIFDNPEQAWAAQEAVSDTGLAEDIFIVGRQEGQNEA